MPQYDAFMIPVSSLGPSFSSFEEQIYRTHLSFDLSRPGAEGASRNMQVGLFDEVFDLSEFLRTRLFVFLAILNVLGRFKISLFITGNYG